MNSKILILLFILLIISPGLFSDEGFSEKGASLFNRGDYTRAIELYQDLLNKNKLTPVDMAIMGICYLKMGNLFDAENIINRAHLLLPDNTYVLLALAHLAFEKKEFDPAYHYFKKVYDKNLHRETALQGMISALVNRGIELYMEGDKNKGKNTLKKALDLAPDESPVLVQVYKNLGLMELESQHYGAAAGYFEKAVKSSPKDAELLRMFILARKKEGSERGVLEAYETLTILDPSNGDNFAELGKIYMEKKKNKHSETAFFKAVELETQEPYPYFFVAKKTNNKDETRYLLHDAIGKAVIKASSLRILAAQTAQNKEEGFSEEEVALLEDISGQIEEPLALLKDSLDLLKLTLSHTMFREDVRMLSSWYPQNLELNLSFGALLIADKEWQEVIPYYEKICQQYPTTSDAHMGMGMGYAGSGKTGPAIISYKRALDLDPENPKIYDHLIGIYRGIDKTAELFEYLEDRSHMNKRSVILFTYLYDLANALGETDKALIYKKRIEELESE
ncbi:MAG: tetratricopeptide repeat protein [Spirochaetales bacterium]|nr:tetratricopeptide repeat protein [Spirochaetales bacterium]